MWANFNDLETLFAATGAEVLSRQDEQFEPVSPELSLPDRIERFCAQRARLLELVAQQARAATLRESVSPQLRANRLMHIKRVTDEVEILFGRELLGLTRTVALRWCRRSGSRPRGRPGRCSATSTLCRWTKRWRSCASRSPRSSRPLCTSHSADPDSVALGIEWSASGFQLLLDAAALRDHERYGLQAEPRKQISHADHETAPARDRGDQPRPVDHGPDGTDDFVGPEQLAGERQR